MRQKISRSFRLRLTAMVLLAILLPVIGFFAIVAYEGTRSVQQTAEEALKTRAGVLSESVYRWDQAMTLAVQNLSQQPDITPMEPAQQEKALMSMADVYTDMYLILTTGLDGDNVARSDGGAPNNYADRAWFQNAAAGDPIARQTLISRTTGKPVIGYAAPIRQEDGRIAGVAFGGTELTSLDEVVGAIQIGETGFGFLVDESGNVLAHPDPAFSAEELVNLSAYPPVQRALANQSGFFTFTDDDGTVWYSYVQVQDNGWGVIIQQTRAEALASLPGFLALFVGLILVVVTLIGALTWLVAGRAVRPIEELTAVAASIAGGNLNESVPITGQDEVGALAAAFSSMTQQLRTLIGSLEERVTNRTRDLALAADIGQDIAQIRDLNQLLSASVERIATRFGFYYVQIYLVDDSGENLVLKAGTGSIGQELLARGHRLPLDENSINGLTAVQKQPIIVADTAQSPFFQPNPSLPYTRSEMAVPLLAGEQILGVVDLQSAEPNALNQDNVPAFAALAGQLAIALENARLFTERALAVQSLQQSQRQAQAILDVVTLPLLISRVRDDQILTANQLLADMLQIPLENLVGNQTPDFYHDPADRHMVIGLIQEQGAVSNVELRLNRHNGDMFWASLSARLFTIDGEPAIITILVDVTAQKETAALLAERIKQLNLLNDIGRRTEQIPPIPELLAWVAEHIPQAAKAPEVCIAAILFEDQVYGQANAFDQPCQIVEGIQVGGERLGQITIAYTETRPFLDEESALIGEIGRRLGGYITGQRLLHKVQATVQDLQTVAEISAVVAAAHNRQQLLQEVVDLTQSRFSLYHVQIYLLDADADELVSAAGSGDIGRRLAAENLRIPRQAGQSLIARSARQRQAQFVQDVHAEPDYLPHPWLPDTQAELAAPLLVGDTLLGVLDIQAGEKNRFTADDLNIHTTLATQIAVALQNVGQFEQTRSALQELDAMQRLMAHEGWQHYLSSQKQGLWGYLAGQGQVKKLVEKVDEETTAVLVPMQVRGTTIGNLGVRQANGRALTDQDHAFLEAISVQVAQALEKTRLFAETEQARSQTEALFSGSERVVRATTMSEILEAVVLSTELKQLDSVSLVLFDQPWQGQTPQHLIVSAVWHKDGAPPEIELGVPYPSASYPILRHLTRVRPFVSPDISQDGRVDEATRHLLVAVRGMKTVVAIPLVAGDAWIGFIMCLSAAANQQPDDEALRQILSLSSQAAAVAQTQNLYEQTRARAQEEQMLRQVTDRMYAAVDAESMLRTAVEEIGRALGMETFVYLNQPADHRNGHATTATAVAQPQEQAQPETPAA